MASPGLPSDALRVAIVGRPNVGKSTLFNRLLGARRAVVSPVRGTTRDRVSGRMRWRDRTLVLTDTGGFEADSASALEAAIQRHIATAVREADVVLFVCDARDGLVPQDELVMDALRPSGKPIVVAVNKVDHGLGPPEEFFEFGLERVHGVSALHGRGIGDLLETLAECASRGESEPETPVSAAVAILGRPNVGKSSLFNALLAEERVIVSERPGTTRDAIDTPIVVGGTRVTIVDTAGLRHRRKVRDPVDMFSMSRSIDAIDRCDAAIMVADATQGVTRDDARIATRVVAAGRGLVLALNKWDLVEGVDPASLPAYIRDQLPFAAFAPVFAISAKTGAGVMAPLESAIDIAFRIRAGVPANEVEALLKAAWTSHPPPRMRGRLVNLKHAVWRAERDGGARRHPGVELSIAPPGPLPAVYRQYLLNRLYADARFRGIPITIAVKEPERLKRRRVRHARGGRRTR
ncbi:MAG TPA: ribosome biogenesis GTPase Der [bacterium]